MRQQYFWCNTISYSTYVISVMYIRKSGYIMKTFVSSAWLVWQKYTTPSGRINYFTLNNTKLYLWPHMEGMNIVPIQQTTRITTKAWAWNSPPKCWLNPSQSSMLWIINGVNKWFMFIVGGYSTPPWFIPNEAYKTFPPFNIIPPRVDITSCFNPWIQLLPEVDDIFCT